ncbi:hypothetical protein XI09_19700 [Bradyrhizobium sp. CCBAU 11386]|nr:hypothetical protein [Bradyrhizobium sp. CCBAU 11386]
MQYVAMGQQLPSAKFKFLMLDPKKRPPRGGLSEFDQLLCSSGWAIAAVLFRLTAALNHPINTVADRKDGETGSSDRHGRAANTTTILTLVIVILTLVILGLGQIRDTEHQSPGQRE